MARLFPLLLAVLGGCATPHSPELPEPARHDVYAMALAHAVSRIQSEYPQVQRRPLVYLCQMDLPLPGLTARPRSAWNEEMSDRVLSSLPACKRDTCRDFCARNVEAPRIPQLVRAGEQEVRRLDESGFKPKAEGESDPDFMRRWDDFTGAAYLVTVSEIGADRTGTQAVVSICFLYPSFWSDVLLERRGADWEIQESCLWGADPKIEPSSPSPRWSSARK